MCADTCTDTCEDARLQLWQSTRRCQYRTEKKKKDTSCGAGAGSALLCVDTCMLSVEVRIEKKRRDKKISLLRAHAYFLCTDLGTDMCAGTFKACAKQLELKGNTAVTRQTLF